jgi:hypothetical protein
MAAQKEVHTRQATRRNARSRSTVEQLCPEAVIFQRVNVLLNYALLLPGRHDRHELTPMLDSTLVRAVGVSSQAGPTPTMALVIAVNRDSGGHGLATLDIVSVAGDVADAGTALAGLILVYLEPRRFVTKHWIPKPKPPREMSTVDMRGEPFAA